MKSACGNQLCLLLHTTCTSSLHSRNAGHLNGMGLLHQSDSSRGCFKSAMRGQARTLRAFTSRRITSRSLHVHAAAATYSKDSPHLQLATAKLSRGVDVPTFASKMYQWASTLTYQGRNMPFALPFRTDPLETGFVLSLLRINNSGRPVSIGDITTTVESEPDVGNVVFVRFYEAEGTGMDRRTPPPADEYKRLKAAADACVDIPTIMASLPLAIKNAAKQARSDV